jgi:hypothetical protein
MGSRQVIRLSAVLVAACSSSGQTTGEDSGTPDSGPGGIVTSLGDASNDAPCSCPDTGDTDASGNPCTTDNDCPSPLRCGYLMADGCSAKGVCVQYTCAGTACVHPGGGPCGCDGHPIDYVNAIIGVGNMTLLYTLAPYGGPCFCAVTWCPDAAPG